MKQQNNSQRLTRRKILQILTAAGITGPAAIQLTAQIRRNEISPEILKTANALIDQEFTEERLRVVATALQRNLEQFELVRALDIDDSVEPAPIFNAASRW
jgi:hypothetical protein